MSKKRIHNCKPYTPKLIGDDGTYLHRLLPDGIRQPLAESHVLAKINLQRAGVAGDIFIAVPTTVDFLLADFSSDDFF